MIVEIRGAEGGEEANLFARDLFEMYPRYADQHAAGSSRSSRESPSERDGLNEVVFLVKGDDAWRRLEHEAGPHRVQRVPVTESKGRVHTSSATVTVLPEADEVDVSIDPADLKIDVYRSTGPGGQSVNTTDSAVRITHLPTGIVVAMQDEKSQIQNRAKAMKVLRARLLKAEQDRRAAELAAQRRSQVGGGGRSEKIRTYNFKENRVTDHRIGLTLHKLDQVLAGDLDDCRRADGRQAGPQLAGQAHAGQTGRGSTTAGDAGRAGWGLQSRRAGWSRRSRRPGARLSSAAELRPGERRPATAAVRARRLGVPHARADRRCPGAHPAARDRAGGRGGPGRARSGVGRPGGGRPGDRDRRHRPVDRRGTSGRPGVGHRRRPRGAGPGPDQPGAGRRDRVGTRQLAAVVRDGRCPIGCGAGSTWWSPTRRT